MNFIHSAETLPVLQLTRDVTSHLKRGHRWIFANGFDDKIKQNSGLYALEFKKELVGFGVVQADTYMGVVSTVVVAEITKNLALAGDPACLFIDVNTPEGKATGLIHDSVLSCLLLATVDADKVAFVLGSLSAAMKQKLDDCLKAGLGIP